MNQIVFAAGVLLFPAVCTTLGAAGVFLLRRSAAPRTQRVLSGMAAGIMLAASVWSLLLPAIERTRELGVAAGCRPRQGWCWGQQVCCGWKAWPGSFCSGARAAWCWR